MDGLIQPSHGAQLPHFARRRALCRPSTAITAAAARAISSELRRPLCYLSSCRVGLGLVRAKWQRRRLGGGGGKGCEEPCTLAVL